MDDLSQKLAGILNDPESMERVRKMAENLFGQDEPPNETGQNESAGMPTGDEIKAIMSIMSKLKGSKDDDRTHLINALKPYLSEQRQAKADAAVKILKLLEILPYIKESGLFNL